MANRHGDSVLFIRHAAVRHYDALKMYRWSGTPHVVATHEGGGVLWEGRLEDITIVPGGVSLTAFGYQRAMSDLLYTGMWTVTSYAGWREVTTNDLADWSSMRYAMDNNNRLYIALSKGESYNNNGHAGGLTWAIPHLGERAPAAFMASYDMRLPVGWQMRILTAGDGFGSPVVEQTINATGGAQSGTISLGLSGGVRIIVSVRNNTGATYTNTANTDEYYMRMTGVQIKSVGVLSTVTASDIAAGLVTYVNSVNPSQLLSDVGSIASTAVNLVQESYEDMTPAEILDSLALREQLVWSVEHDRVLRLAPASSGRRWSVDASESIALSQSMADAANRVYVQYRDRDSRAKRTTRATADTGRVYRDRTYHDQTTSQAQAEAIRDALLVDSAQNHSRNSIVIRSLYSTSGARVPIWSVRPGDVVTVRDISPTTDIDADNVRRFIVSETSYNVDTGEMTLTPALPVPTLVTLLASVLQ